MDALAQEVKLVEAQLNAIKEGSEMFAGNVKQAGTAVV